MRASYGIGQLSAAEKSDILDQHKSLYNGYQTMQPQVSNTQPLYVYDPAGDKDGLVVNNKGEVKKYTNMGINEQVEEKSMCECGGEMYEGECMECGDMYEMEENKKFEQELPQLGTKEFNDLASALFGGKPKGTKTEKNIKKVNSISKKYGMDEETGHLDDIYKVKDLNLSHGDFDYVQGGGNDYGTFEGMHKNLYKEDDVIDDDGFEDMELSTDELDEQGGNADDMDTDSVEPAYDFESNGPDSVYPVNEYDDEDDFKFEPMESAWANEEIDEVDVSGSQGIYGDMEPAYDFDSEGPGKGGPYQTFSYNEDEDMDSSEELYPSFSSDGEFMGMSKPMGDMETSDEDEWEEIDTDLQEDFKNQKNKISEMFNRMSRYN